MLPVLLHIPVFGRVFELHSFGVLVALGCALGTLMAMREARIRGVDVAQVRDLCLWGLAASLLGARLFDLGTNGRQAWDDCLDAVATSGGLAALDACTRPLRPWEGGLAFYGGVLAGLLTIWRFTARHGMPLGATMDLLTPGIPLGHAFGRLGCLLAGCCWGKPTLAPWGIAFPDGSVAYQELAARGELVLGAARTMPLHPTQLYEVAGELALFVLLVALRRRGRSTPMPAGRLALTWLAGYSGLRFVIELFRGDPSRNYLVTLSTPGLDRALGLPAGSPALLSTSQGIALGLLVAALVLLLRQWRQQRHAGAGGPRSRPAATPSSSGAPPPGSPPAPAPASAPRG